MPNNRDADGCGWIEYTNGHGVLENASSHLRRRDNGRVDVELISGAFLCISRQLAKVLNDGGDAPVRSYGVTFESFNRFEERAPERRSSKKQE